MHVMRAVQWRRRSEEEMVVDVYGNVSGSGCGGGSGVTVLRFLLHCLRLSFAFVNFCGFDQL